MTIRLVGHTGVCCEPPINTWSDEYLLDALATVKGWSHLDDAVAGDHQYAVLMDAVIREEVVGEIARRGLADA
jgi:hypothetical protein